MPALTRARQEGTLTRIHRPVPHARTTHGSDD
jgi:hypothetical protein